MRNNIVALCVILLMFMLWPLAAHAQKVPLHVTISNQSFEKPMVRVELSVDKQELFNDMLPVRDQHYTKDFQTPVVIGTRHQILITAPDLNVAGNLVLDIDRENYIYIDLWCEEDSDVCGFSFVLNDEALGLD